MALEHATHTTYKITRFDSEEWLNYNKKERSKPLKNEPNCLKPDELLCTLFLIYVVILDIVALLSVRRYAREDTPV